MSAEYQRWADAEYPYDRAECGACLSNHQGDLCCTRRSHANLRAEAEKLNLVKLVNKLRVMTYNPGIVEIRKTFLKLRRKHRKLWRTK
jgi:hypothetical protein